jgi:hypothetical protein
MSHNSLRLCFLVEYALGGVTQIVRVSASNPNFARSEIERRLPLRKVGYVLAIPASNR